MERATHSSDTSSTVFLTGAILLANMDYNGLFDYAIKAVIGGAIWMAYKVAGDYFSERLSKKHKHKPPG